MTEEEVEVLIHGKEDARLLGQHHPNKLLVVDVTLSVLLPMDEDLDLFFGHLLHHSDPRDRDLGVSFSVEQEEALLEVPQLVLGEPALLRHLLLPPLSCRSESSNI